MVNPIGILTILEGGIAMIKFSSPQELNEGLPSGSCPSMHFGGSCGQSCQDIGDWDGSTGFINVFAS